MHDIAIRGGTILDGTGAAAFSGDLAINGALIAQVGGKVGGTGATGEVTMFLEKQGEASAQVLDLVRLTLPAWPALPMEPIAPGAKWTASCAMPQG